MLRAKRPGKKECYVPNHCECDLYVDGPRKVVAEFYRHMGVNIGKFDLGAIVPYPAEYQALDDEYAALGHYEWRKKYGAKPNGYNSGGYEWCCDVWGTKWGCYDVKRGKVNGRKCLHFKCAWNPPSEAIFAKMVKLFPGLVLRLEWFERGMGICGGQAWGDPDNSEPWRGAYNGIRGG